MQTPLGKRPVPLRSSTGHGGDDVAVASLLNKSASAWVRSARLASQARAAFSRELGRVARHPGQIGLTGL